MPLIIHRTRRCVYARNAWRGLSAPLRSVIVMQKLCHMIKALLFALNNMTTAVVFWGELRAELKGELKEEASWVADLQDSGVQVLTTVTQCSNLVQIVQLHAPDVVVCHVPQVDEVFFGAVALLRSPVPCALLVFTQTDSVQATARAIACGIHAFVVNGYTSQRLSALITLARARCQHDQALRAQVLDLTCRLDERKAVDRAKGILMQARQVSDDDAYRMLRTASMQSNQRLGEVSQQVIESAHFADAVNRAGQLRMLSQRLVKLYVLQLNATPSASSTSPIVPASLALHKSALKASVKRVDETLSFLDKNLSSRTSVLGESGVVDRLAPLLQALLATWLPLKKALQGLPQSTRVASIDLLAEQLLAVGGKGEGAAAREVIRAVLGLPTERVADPGFWPSQTEVARLLGISRMTVYRATRPQRSPESSPRAPAGPG